MRQLHSYQEKDLPSVDINPKEIQRKPIHCAKAVLEGIQERTGIGDPLLERLSLFSMEGWDIKGKYAVLSPEQFWV